MGKIVRTCLARTSVMGLILAASPAAAQTSGSGASKATEKTQIVVTGEPDKPNTGDKVVDALSQPLVDLGLKKTEIPEILKAAFAKPYSRTGMTKCAAIRSEIVKLDEALGRDFDDPIPAEGPDIEDKALGQAGRMLSGKIIPFRGIVRELTGSADAKRDLDNAVDAGLTRRGFLKGLGVSKGCAAAAPEVSYNVAHKAKEDKRKAKEAAKKAEAERKQAEKDRKVAEKAKAAAEREACKAAPDPKPDHCKRNILGDLFGSSKKKDPKQ